MCIKMFCNSDAEVIPGRGHLVGRSTNLKVVIILKINKRKLTKGYDWMMVKKIKFFTSSSIVGKWWEKLAQVFAKKIMYLCMSENF